MREYQRTTIERSLAKLPPTAIGAFRAYAEKNDQAFPGDDIRYCCETVSERTRTGLFGRLFGARHAGHTYIVLLKDRLLWCTADQKGGATVMSALLSEVEIKDFSSDLIEDSGLQVYGFVNGSAERISAFVPVGQDAAGRRLRQLTQA